MTSKSQIEKLQEEMEYGLTLREISNCIHSAKDLNEIFIDLQQDILSLFDAERITLYAVDVVHKELYSKFMVGNEIKEIRVPINNESIAGYAAYTKKLVTIQNAYDPDQLKNIDHLLKFNTYWDQRSGYKTQQVLTAPILFGESLQGIIQLINKKKGIVFSSQDGDSITEIAKILGIAFYNQRKLGRRQATKFDYLLNHHIITSRELEEAIKEARDQKHDVESILMRKLRVSKESIGKSLSEFYGCKFIHFNERALIPKKLLTGLKVQYLSNNIWVPLEQTGETVVVAIDNPYDLERTDFIKQKFADKDCEFVVGLKDDITKYIHLFFGKETTNASISDILKTLDNKDAEGTGFHVTQELQENDSAVAQLVNKIIIDAYNKNASDIHIESYGGRKNTEVRLRIDGVCIPYHTFPYNAKMAVISRIKIMAQLDIAERRMPQDGKIKVKIRGGREVELRVATIPTAQGTEDIVMRVLASNEPIPLDKLNMSSRNLNNFKEIIQRPYGIVLVVGPTGSGKTTTLHSALNYINTAEKKIWTAEDPVEITQYGLRQVQVNSKIGLTFAAAMRAFLRADPDVIMVGEMRDEETAATGIEASLTGHLVFSTLHTNSAPETITRLLDMGMDPFNFSDALLGVLAQRLIRVLCKKCKEPYMLSKEEFDNLVVEYGEESFKDLGLTKTTEMNFYRPVGCDACDNTGYTGRMSIHELLLGSDSIKALVQNKMGVAKIRKQAIKEGMRTLKQDGIEKAMKGHTDIRQVRAVCIK